MCLFQSGHCIVVFVILHSLRNRPVFHTVVGTSVANNSALVLYYALHYIEPYVLYIVYRVVRHSRALHVCFGSSFLYP